MTAAWGGSFTELLLNEADIGEFDALVDRAREERAPAERLAALERERANALRLREKLTRHRRHEAELQLLNDTANDLASMRDLDSILQAIADRARRLLDCDLAYVSLRDRSRGDCYIKAASGNISGLLRGLRLPQGAGVGGMVARTGEPYTVASYWEDTALVRTPELDRTVAAEGIVSLLGVPVKLKQEVIGVLLAAHRGTRAFGSGDIGALVMLGTHAAVAIENSRLLSAAEAAVEDLRVANATIRSHVADLERMAEVHERLTKLVLEGSGCDEVAEATADAVDGRVILADEHGELISASGAEPFPLTREELLRIGLEARTSGHTVVRGRLCAVPMITDAEVLGTVVLVGSREVGDTDRRVLERATLVASLVLVTRRRVAEAEGRVRGELLGDLLASQPREYDLLRHRASILGVDLDACRVVVVAHLDEDPRERLFASTAALARRFHGLATYHQGAVVLLLPGDDPRTVAKEAARELSRASRRPVTAGTARAEDVSAVADAYQEAAKCMRALLSLGRVGDTADARELGFVGALFSGRPDIGAFVDSVIGPVIAYDRAHCSDLVRTLEVFFATGQNTRNAAQVLHLHANTVTQRLTRIGQLLGASWREPERLLEIQVAVRLLRVSGS